MTIEFFWTPGGPFALRCLMTLAAKEVPYQSRQLDVSKQENRTPEFLAVNPLGTLPVLRDNFTVVRESQAIMFYLDRAFPRAPLYGETPAEAGKIMEEMCEQQSYAEPAIRPLLGALVFKRAMSTDELTSAVGQFETLLENVNGRLAATGWLAGERLTAADINLYPLLRSVVEGLSSEKAAGLRLQVPAINPDVLAWMQRLRPLAEAEQ